jgi:hypothetical protein
MECFMVKTGIGRFFGALTLIGVVVALACPCTVNAGPITLLTDQPTKLKYTDFDRIIKGAGNTGPGIQMGDTLEGVFFTTDIGSTGNSTLLNGQLAHTQLTGYFHISVVSNPDASGNAMLALNAGDKFAFYTNSPNTFKNSGGVSVANDITLATSGTLWAQAGPGGMPFGEFFGTGTTKILINFDVNNTGYLFTPTAWFQGFPLNIGTLGDSGITSNIRQLNPANPDDKNALKAGWQFASEDPALLNAGIIPEPSSVILLGLGAMVVCTGVVLRRRVANIA